MPENFINPVSPQSPVTALRENKIISVVNSIVKGTGFDASGGALTAEKQKVFYQKLAGTNENIIVMRDDLSDTIVPGQVVEIIPSMSDSAESDVSTQSSTKRVYRVKAIEPTENQNPRRMITNIAIMMTPLDDDRPTGEAVSRGIALAKFYEPASIAAMAEADKPKTMMIHGAQAAGTYDLVRDFSLPVADILWVDSLTSGSRWAVVSIPSKEDITAQIYKVRTTSATIAQVSPVDSAGATQGEEIWFGVLP